MSRSAELLVVIGQKEIGKSTTTLNFLRKYVTVSPGRRVLIMDAQDEYGSHADIKTLPLNKISIFSVHPSIEMRRILPYNSKGAEMTPDEKAKSVLHILHHFKNGLLLLEDINNYIFDYMPGDVIGHILSQRHKGVDVILHYHSMGRIHKKIWPHINTIRMHKCEDSVIDNKDKFPDKFEMFRLAEIIVNNQYSKGNIHFFLFLRLSQRKIHADIEIADRDLAIQEYISTGKLIKGMLEMRTPTGKKVHTYASAYEAQNSRIISTYFTNK